MEKLLIILFLLSAQIATASVQTWDDLNVLTNYDKHELRGIQTSTQVTVLVSDKTDREFLNLFRKNPGLSIGLNPLKKITTVYSKTGYIDRLNFFGAKYFAINWYPEGVLSIIKEYEKRTRVESPSYGTAVVVLSFLLLACMGYILITKIN